MIFNFFNFMYINDSWFFGGGMKRKGERHFEKLEARSKKRKVEKKSEKEEEEEDIRVEEREEDEDVGVELTKGIEVESKQEEEESEESESENEEIELKDKESDEGSEEVEKESEISQEKSQNQKKKKVLSAEAIEKWNKKQDKRGIIYISSIPPFMKLVKLRQLLSQYGKIDRIYLTPDTRNANQKQKKVDSRSRAKYTDGWVEFLDKAVAKQVAETLNMTQVGGSRKSQNYHDVWNMRYLRGFKWSHLTEKIAYDKALKEQKLRAELRQMKRANNMYLSAVENAS